MTENLQLNEKLGSGEFGGKFGDKKMEYVRQNFGVMTRISRKGFFSVFG